MNYLWACMIMIGVVYGALTGNLGAVTDQALASAKEAVTLCLTMAGVMAFWVGIMRIAERAGLVEGISGALGPLLSFLFPDVPKDSGARKHIATNMVANFLGLGWAATPAGLSAMKELKKLDKESGSASDAMCDFLILNISSLQLIPVNIIAYRSQYGSVAPAAIVGPAILATAVSTGAAVLFIKLRRLLGGGRT
ncbi:MAG: nucleoside recognition protein [Blautia sp.]|nr:nucleoside recognition protein [Blautia sp.]